MPEEQEGEVVVIEVSLDDRSLEYILTDIFEVRGRRYATLYCDEDFLDNEDRTLFARVNEVDGEDRFDILGDSDELEMVIANATIGVLDDLLLEVRGRVQSLVKLLSPIDLSTLPEKERTVVELSQNGLIAILETLNSDDANEEEPVE